MKFQPLKGRTILDCSSLLPGPFLTKLLVDRGATVIKVEDPRYGDPAKELGTYYDFLNAEKQIVGLNLKDENDWSKFSKLVEKADGLVEGFRPSTKQKLGLTEERLHAVNPSLVIVSLLGFPPSSPMADRPTHNLNLEALTGVLSLSDGIPPLPLADLFSSYTGALEMCAHLDHRGRSGKGTHISVSLSGAMMEAQGKFFHEYLSTQTLPQPGKTLALGRFPCYRIYQSKEGKRISVAPLEQKYWEAFCDAINTSHLKDMKYSDDPAVGEEVSQALASRTWSDWAPIFNKANCCVEPVLDYGEAWKKKSELM